MLIYYFLFNLIIISIFLGIILGFVSSYAVVRKWSLLGDIISHAALPGIVYIFLLFKNQNIFIMLLGGALSSLLSTIFSFYIQRYKSIPKDSAFALILSLFFSFGIIGMTIIQKKAIVGQSIINNFIYGNIVSFASGNVYFYIFFSLIISLLFYISFQIQKCIAFDKVFSNVRYKSINFWEFLLLFVSIVSIIIGLQAVGILLMGALIIAPGSAARLISNSYFKMTLYSILITVFSFLIGIFISLKYSNIPTGPVIALTPIIIFLIIKFFRKIKFKKL